MGTKFEEKDGTLTVILEGRMDTLAAHKFQAEVNQVYETECKEIVIECSKLDYIASSGLRLMLTMLLDTQPQGKHIIVRNMNERLRELFDMTGFSGLFDFQ